MSDLISRSTAMKNYCNALCPKLQKGEYCNNCIVKAWLNNQPTAYDVDKVVEQLKLTSKTALDLAIKRIPGFRFMAPAFQALIDECFEEAVEIVKAGGNT